MVWFGSKLARLNSDPAKVKVRVISPGRVEPSSYSASTWLLPFLLHASATSHGHHRVGAHQPGSHSLLPFLPHQPASLNHQPTKIRGFPRTGHYHVPRFAAAPPITAFLTAPSSTHPTGYRSLISPCDHAVVFDRRCRQPPARRPATESHCHAPASPKAPPCNCNMSSLRNAIPRRAHKERAQPSSRKKFGLLEKHKDYVERAKAFHKKEDTIRRLREKAANRNEDEFYFKMIKTKVVDGVHKPESDANKYTQEELLLMKTQDIGYILQKLQSERKAKELQSQNLRREVHLPLTSDDLPTNIKRKIAKSYKELEARKTRLGQLEKIYLDMSMQKELQKKGKKRKLREDELVTPASKSVYKWHAERKR
ncbi:hypothetical protein Ahy_B03g062172 isoform A [Arachis hypogaea]|uniref:U3 small nucleolar RNA-associated protein 11 n=1 Tax=Arachis hypogaea TaxID=3818 RepID=A0A444ZT76_ARAHY|nr:hypothetical protein Ahy_B03g062172 isoform A [Arachis hypogaea]